MEVIEADLLVIGGGISGMSAAGRAAELGAAVIVVETAKELGGSAVLSNGTVWTAETVEDGLAVNPFGDPDLVRVLIEEFEDAVAWVVSAGTEMTTRQSLTPAMGWPSVGYTIDVLGFIQSMRSRVVQAGGHVVLEATPESLVVDDGGTVRGAIVRDRDGLTEVRSPWTLLASGGFQNDPELRERYIGGGARNMMVRSNKASSGTGLRLGLSVDAALSAHMDSFYGHVMPAPLDREIDRRDYLRFTQLYSPHAVLLDAAGRRFVDESISYHENGRAVNRQPGARALIVGDETIREFDRSGYGVAEQMDRVVEAALGGANVTFADTWDEVSVEAGKWGYRRVADAVAAFNRAVVEEPSALSPGRIRNRRPLDQPPFFAMEVQPAITFTMGGLRTDVDAHVLREDGAVIPGLLAAGVDAGGIYHDAYLGGLSLGLVSGRRAAQTAVDG